MRSIKFQDNMSFRVTTVFAPSDVGIFAIYPQEECYFNSYWDTCREQFARKFLKSSFGFFVSVDAQHLISVPKFISECENVLQIKKKSLFYLTDLKNVIFIIPSRFWAKCYMRRSLFTLLCRLGIIYHLNPKFEDLLLGNLNETKNDKIDTSLGFARSTEDAILRFFGGFCHYIGEGPNYHEYFPEKHGWVAEFRGKERNYVKKVLIDKKFEKLMLNYFHESIFLS